MGWRYYIRIFIIILKECLGLSSFFFLTIDLFALAARKLWNPMFYIVNIAALFGLLGLGITFLSTSSEAIAHSARWKYVPKIAQQRTKRGKSPWLPILVQGVCFVFKKNFIWWYNTSLWVCFECYVTYIYIYIYISFSFKF